MVVELCLFQTVVILKQFNSVISSSFKYQIVDPNANDFWDLYLQGKHRYASINNNIVLVNVVLTVKNLLSGYGSVGDFWTLQLCWVIEFDLEA